MSELSIVVDVFAQESKIYVEERHDTFLQINPLGDDIKINVEGSNDTFIQVATDDIVGVRLFDNYLLNNVTNGSLSLGDADTLDGYDSIEFPRKAEWASITGRWNFLSRIGIKAESHAEILADFHNYGTTILHDNVQFGGSLVKEGENAFASGFSGYGWKLDGVTNHLIIDSLTVRKQLKVYELLISQIRANNGSVWISDGAKIDSVVDNTTYWRCYIDTSDNTIGVPFRVNDLVRCQRWNGNSVKYYSATVIGIGGNYFDLEKSSKEGESIPQANDDVVRIGNSDAESGRQGSIYLTASDDNAPYIDVLDGVDTYSFAGKVKARLGRLDGITYAGGDLSGYGLFSDNVYLTGAIRNLTGAWALNTDGSGVLANGAISWTNTGELTIGSYLSNSDFNTWLASDFADLSSRVAGAEDGQFVLYYQSGNPADNYIEPYSNYLGDQWYDTISKKHYYWDILSTNPDIYGWKEMERQDVIDAYDLADGKRRIFVNEPIPPYEQGDLWLTGGLNPASGDIMKCILTRDTGTFVAADWVKAADYTDINDGSKVYIGGADPSTNWTNDTQRAEHIGDTWYQEEIINGVSELVRYYYFQTTPTPTFAWVRDETKIDGGRILTGTIEAQQINIDSLVADEAFIDKLNAHNFESITATIASGKIGNFYIDNKLESRNNSGDNIILDPDQRTILITEDNKQRIKLMSDGLSSIPSLYGGALKVLSMQELIEPLQYDKNLEDNLYGYGIQATFELLTDGGAPQAVWTSNVTNPENRGVTVPQNTLISTRLPFSIALAHDGSTGDNNVSNRIVGHWLMGITFSLVLCDGTNHSIVKNVTATIDEIVDFNTGELKRSFTPVVEVDTGSYTKAYWRVYISSPPLSNGLKYIWYDYKNNWFDKSDWKSSSRTVAIQLNIEPGMNFAAGDGRTEIASNGLQSVWSANKYFRVDGNSTAFIQSQGEWWHNGVKIEFTPDGEVTGNLDPASIVRVYYLDDNYYDKTTSDNRYARLVNNNIFTGNQTIGGNLIVNGNIIQNGDTYETHAEQVYTAQDLIISREGALAGLAVGEISGLKILIADGTNNLIMGGDRTGLARVGWEGGILQAIATREDSPTSGYVAVWDGINDRFNTVNDITLANITVNTGARITNLEAFTEAQFYDGLQADAVAIFNDGISVSGASTMQGVTFSPYLDIWDGNIIQRNGNLTIAANDTLFLYANTFNHVKYYDDQIAEYLSTENYWTGYHQSAIYGGDQFDGSGWKIHPNVNNESCLYVDNIVVRRTIKAYEMEIDEITHAGGVIALSAAHGKVTSITGTGPYNLYFDTDEGNNPVQFAVGDVVFAQRYSGVNAGSFRGRVTAVYQYNATTQAEGYITVTALPGGGTPYLNMELVQMGNDTDTTRQAMVFMNALNNPYVRLYGGMTDGTFAGHLLASYGYLGDINSPAHGQLTGDGIYVNRGYFENVYVSGEITATGGNFDWLLANVINTNYIEGLSLDFIQGTIGALTISSDRISGNNIEWLSTGTLRHTGGMWSLNGDGSVIVSSGDFSVDASGKLTAINADIEGHIEAASGLIGGFTSDNGAFWNGISKAEPYIILDATNKKISVTGNGDYGDGYCTVYGSMNGLFGIDIKTSSGYIMRAGKWGNGDDESGLFIKGNVTCQSFKMNFYSVELDDYSDNPTILPNGYSMYFITMYYTYIQAPFNQIIQLRAMDVGEQINIVFNSNGAEAGHGLIFYDSNGIGNIGYYLYNVSFSNGFNIIYRITRVQATGTMHQQYIVEPITTTTS